MGFADLDAPYEDAAADRIGPVSRVRLTPREDHSSCERPRIRRRAIAAAAVAGIVLVIYVVLGMVWAFPLKRLVMGTGRAAPPSEPGSSR